MHEKTGVKDELLAPLPLVDGEPLTITLVFPEQEPSALDEFLDEDNVKTEPSGRTIITTQLMDPRTPAASARPAIPRVPTQTSPATLRPSAVPGLSLILNDAGEDLDFGGRTIPGVAPPVATTKKRR